MSGEAELAAVRPGDPAMLRAICLPSADVAFTAVVDRFARERQPATPAALEDLLRPLFPFASVRARDLAGEDGTTWYVYRDGRFVPNGGVPWWEEEGVPAVRLGLPRGEITYANPAIAALVASTPDRMVGRPYLDYVVPDARPAAAVLFETCIRLGTIETVVRVLREDGETATFEVHAFVLGDEIEIRYRPIAVAADRAGEL